MAKPRRIVPGATHLLTRRVCRRTFRLRPSPQTNQIALYCLGWAAAKVGLLVHAFVLMSNHYHLEATDPEGRLPEFLREFHRTMAKALNASQGQRENLWSSEHASAVLLPTIDDMVDEIAYIAANPVAAALVDRPEVWPGVLYWEPGTTVIVPRPPVYFNPRGRAPETVEIRIVAPPQVEGDERDWAQRIRQAVADKVEKAQDDVRKHGMKFMGAAAVMAKSFLDRAKSYEQKRQINPTVAARDVMVRKTILRILREFRRAYRAALLAWQAGDRLAAFPFGTWWMHVHHKAQVLPEHG